MQSAHSTAKEEPAKVGVVVLRRVGTEYEILVTQPKPTADPGFNTAMGLVRGTRRYRNAQGEWVEGNRDGEPQPQGVEWEPLYHTLVPELHEEADIKLAQVKRHPIYDLGERPFTKQRGEHKSFGIHWLVMVLDDKAQASMAHIGRPYKTTKFEPGYIRDSLKSEWMSLERFTALAAVPYEDHARDRVHPEYLSIAKQAIAGMKTQSLNELAERPPLRAALKKAPVEPKGRVNGDSAFAPKR